MLVFVVPGQRFLQQSQQHWMAQGQRFLELCDAVDLEKSRVEERQLPRRLVALASAEWDKEVSMWLWNLAGTVTSTSEDQRDLPSPESVLCEPSTDVLSAEKMFCAVENNLE
ncbi:unnamed protein product [Rangifer tarandus platyrhynchus]|uniref:Uncharacterized protein n=1 Tax=Rangifer tarandus platyrhynchus TaxID=3082113 RepID=A0AC59ZQ14_RANTA